MVKKRKRKTKTKPKARPRPPRVYTSKTGRHYIRRKGKRLYFNSKSELRKLIRLVIKEYNNKKQKKRKRVKRRRPTRAAAAAKPFSYPVVSGGVGQSAHVQALEKEMIGITNGIKLLEGKRKEQEKQKQLLLENGGSKTLTIESVQVAAAATGQTLSNAQAQEIIDRYKEDRQETLASLQELKDERQRLLAEIDAQRRDIDHAQQEYEKEIGQMQEYHARLERQRMEEEEEWGKKIKKAGNELLQMDHEKNRLLQEREYDRQKHDNEIAMKEERIAKGARELLSARDDIARKGFDASKAVKYLKNTRGYAKMTRGSIIKMTNQQNMYYRNKDDLWDAYGLKDDDYFKQMVLSGETPTEAASYVEDEYFAAPDFYYEGDRFVSDEDDDDMPALVEEQQAGQPQQAGPPQGGSGKGNSGLTDRHINRAMRHHKRYVGTFAMDEFKDVPTKRKMGFIINTNKRKSRSKQGHWVAVYIDADGDKSVEYYDSFGEDIPKSVLIGIKKVIDKLKLPHYLKMKINKIKDQRTNTSTCGFHAMTFLLRRFKGVPFKECTGYSNVTKGEKNADKMKKKFQTFGYV